MKSKIDTALLGLITVLLIALVVLVSRPAPQPTVQAGYFTWDDTNRPHEDSKGNSWHTVVKFCTLSYGAPDRFSSPFRVYSPADAVKWLADDGWQLTWSDGKTWMVQRIGDPKGWRYSNFMVVPEQD